MSRNALLDLYFKIILPTVLYSLEIPHQRAARVIYNLPRDMSTDEVYRHSNWNTLTVYYKLRLFQPLHSVFIGEAPAALSYLTNKPCTAYNFRRSSNTILAIEAQILRNAVSTHSFTGQFTAFYDKVKKDFYLEGT